MKTTLTLLLMAVSAYAAKNPPPVCVTGPQAISLDGWVESGAFFGRSKNASSSGSGFYFDFPSYTSDKYIGYLTKTMCGGIYGSNYLSITLRVVTTGIPVFMYDSEPDNSPANGCNAPASVHAYFQSGGSGEYDRWWSNPIAYTLAPGQITLSIPLTSDQWSSLYGKAGSFDAASSAGFVNAQQHTQQIGMTFGGGCFFGHGVNVLNGTARFTMLEFKAAP